MNEVRNKLTICFRIANVPRSYTDFTLIFEFHQTCLIDVIINEF